MPPAIDAHDRRILRDLAREVADMAALPVMAERRAAWRRHNRLERGRPMILVFPEGAWRELLPDTTLQCTDERLRGWEGALRQTLYTCHHIGDDQVVEPIWIVRRAISHTGWGLEPHYKPSTEHLGAWAFDPVIVTPADLGKLRYPEVRHDEAASAAALIEAQELFGDILDVQLRGIGHISFHLMSQYCRLRGLEQVMWDMVDNPGMLHDAMAFFEAGNRRLVEQYDRLNLFSLNNDGTYHSSGGLGYSDELPRPGYDPAHIRPADLWSSAEAQEMAQISPAMHREFILDYEKRLLAPFGLNGYGCCEDLTDKLADVLAIPHIRRISISPFADVVRCAAQLGRRAICSWKPHPAHLVGTFDPDKVRSYLRHGLDATRDCVTELILKDTHTCENHPKRFTAWTRIARELAWPA
jgi:hypothetical protein